MKRGVFFGLLGVVVLFVALVGLFRRSPTRNVAARGALGTHDRSGDPDDPTPTLAPDETATVRPASPPEHATDTPAPPALDQAKRDQMRALLWHALGQPAPAAAAPPSKGAAYVLPLRPSWADAADATFGHLDPDDIRSAVRNDFFPLAKDCYAKATEKDPTLGGSVVLAFNIVGDEKIGGIVEAVDVLDKSTLRDPDMIECMRQSFLSTTFPPPRGGGTVTVEYPIEFSNGDGGE